MAGIANATVNTISGVARALSDYSFPYSVAIGAAVAAAGAAQINAIRSTSFQGGGRGVAPSNAATPAANVGQGNGSGGGGGGGGNGGSQTLRVEGITADSLLTGRMVRSLADKLSDHVKDGGRVEWA
jgi:hypothetical protein